MSTNFAFFERTTNTSAQRALGSIEMHPFPVPVARHTQGSGPTEPFAQEAHAR